MPSWNLKPCIRFGGRLQPLGGQGQQQPSGSIVGWLCVELSWSGIRSIVGSVAGGAEWVAAWIGGWRPGPASQNGPLEAFLPLAIQKNNDQKKKPVQNTWVASGKWKDVSG